MEKLLDAFANLSRRDQALVAGAILLALLGLVGGSMALARSHCQAIERRTADKRERLEAIMAQRDLYLEARRRQEAEERRLRTGGEVALFPLLEKVATRLDVSIADLNERKGAVVQGQVKETRVEVSVRQVTFDRVIDFVTQVEREESRVRVTELRVKRRFDDATKVDAQFTVSAFAIADEG